MPEETLHAPSLDNINKEGSQLHRKETWANERASASAPSPQSSCLPSRTPPPHQEVPGRVQVCSRKSWQHLRGQKELGLKKKNQSFEGKKRRVQGAGSQEQGEVPPAPSGAQWRGVPGGLPHAPGRAGTARGWVDTWSVPLWQLLFSCENRDFMVQDQLCQIKSKCNNH